MRLEIVTTACRRPGIIRDSYASLVQNLTGVDWPGSKLFINIDPVPAEGDGGAVILAAREFFGDVVVNEPDHANFAAAVKWCYSQPGGEYFLAWEDDWLLERQVSVDDMLCPLRNDPGLSCVNIRVYPHDDARLCLAPGLWRTDHAKAIAEKMRTDCNPEMQLRPMSSSNPHGGIHKGYRGMQMPGPRALKDMGRPWMLRNGLVRAKERHFIRWEQRRR
jgi:hypothetical protein